ncbi:MAG: two-component system, OmpR family, operon response regulator KdpE [Pseudonocardiales bacterium]|nr:two-component system, OmpR family, operon response regulator KdpE [Pseudonocardiales bacterium]
MTTPRYTSRRPSGGILQQLARNRGRLVGQRQLLHGIWGPAYDKETNYLRVYLAQLRRKLEPDPAHPQHLITEPGMATASRGDHPLGDVRGTEPPRSPWRPVCVRDD